MPFSVLLCTPIAVFGAFGALWALGLENNVFTQIGLVMLIGLSAKNAILIVEFAKVEYEKGKTRRGVGSHRRPPAATAHSDDVIRVYPRGCPARPVFRSRGARQNPARYCRPGWDAGGEFHCDLLDPGRLHCRGEPGASP